jgi:hypothetical protein
MAVWSGDRAVRGEDGLIRFRGRDDAMIKVSGNRLSPTEIEEAALASGAVREVLALGIKDAPSPIVGTRLADHPTWSRVYIERIREAITNGYHVRNIEHVVHGPYGLDRVLLISMIGIVENGHVLRFWGSGRDVTAMREAENALAQHDSQLRALATEITLAEERARRKLAGELHDGPAQNLTGMSLALAAIKRKLTDREQVERIVEIEQVLADTTLQTRTLMLELAPPGLHENGLVDALRWLAECGTELYFFVDSTECVQVAASTGSPVNVFAELGYAGGRAGCRSAAELVEVATAVRASATVKLHGVAGYEGGLPDAPARRSVTPPTVVPSG